MTEAQKLIRDIAAWYNGGDLKGLWPGEALMNRAVAMVARWDSEVNVEFDLNEDELLRIAMMAHDRDITMNEMIVEILEAAVAEADRVQKAQRVRIKEIAPYGFAKTVDELPKADSLGHRTRFSDSSIYDEVCVLCGATDSPGSKTLNKPCPRPYGGVDPDYTGPGSHG